MHSVMQVNLSSTDSVSAQDKLAQLRENLSQLSRVLIAYSGGVDSAFLLHVAHGLLGERAQAVIGISPSLLPEELEEARALARHIGANLREVQTHEIEDPNYNSNPNNRCYFCKSELYSVLNTIALKENFEAVCDGTNIDDLNEWRPGAMAATENRVLSPLREAGFTKNEIRLLSKEFGLPTWDKPAMPCLSSRIPYGTPVTPQALQMIGRAETFLRGKGLRELRVRHYIENEVPVARLEVAPDELPLVFEFYQQATEYLRELGYSKVLLDLEGYRRGKMNDAIGASPQPVTLFIN